MKMILSVVPYLIVNTIWVYIEFEPKPAKVSHSLPVDFIRLQIRLIKEERCH